MPFRQPGPWIFALATSAAGLAVLLFLWSGQRSPSLGSWMIPHLCQVLLGAGLLVPRTSVISAIGLALYQLAWLVFLLVPDLVSSPGDIPAWVRAAQGLTFAAVAAALARPTLWPVARIVLGLTVVLFGAIHTLHPQMVSELLPSWFPLPRLWPYLTGPVQIGLGVMMLVGFRAYVAAFVLGLMWLSWVPLVHIPRLIASPGVAFEWTFMLTALTLAGAAWTVGERIAARSGEDFQPSPH